ncbi:MAG: hypothetical protein R6V12_04730 [Candidatus Hydrogenedentota bacterium]
MVDRNEDKHHEKSFFSRAISWPFRRWRWVVAGILCLLAIYAVTDQLLMKKLARQSQRFREEGRPTTFAEMGLGNLPPSENAALIYRSAVQSMKTALSGHEHLRQRFIDITTCPRHRKEDDGDYTPLSQRELRTIESHIQALAPALEKVREARTMPGCEFGNYAVLSGAATNPAAVLPDLGNVRVIARNLAYKAVWEAQQGNTEEALKWVAANMRLANDLTGDPLLITGLVRVAVASMAVDSLERILHDRELPENVPEELYAELAGLRDRENLARFIDGERCFVAAHAASPQVGYFARVFYYSPGLANIYEVTSILANALEEEDYARRCELLAPLEAYKATPTSQQSLLPMKKRGATGLLGGFTAPWNMMAEVTAPALVKAADAFERLIALADLARIALAIKAFHRDTDNYPESLSRLVPAYLETLPRDPFSGSDFIYRADETGFLLYSVGPDLDDDGGMPFDKLHGDIVWCGGLQQG